MTTIATRLEHLILELINESRAAAGLQPITMELTLNTSADAHSQWITDTDTFSHTGARGTEPRERIQEAGVDLRDGWGTAENIAAHPYFSSENDRTELQAQTIHDGFMNSPPHRANIMTPEFTHMGIGVVYGPLTFGTVSANAVIVTQNFAYSGGTLDEDLRGTDGQDNLTAGVGDDALTGLGGNDTLDGKGGNDTLDGSAGNDFLKGGKGNDTLRDTEGNNRLNGQKGEDHLIGGDGKDRLNGGGDQDTLEAGGGDDFLKGGTHNDHLTGGKGNDRLFGNRHDDTLDGGSGDDVLNGGGGNDSLIGGAGDDRLKGGDGADVFVFNTGSDLIEDYDPDQDRIELDRALYGADASTVIADLTTLTSTGAVVDFGRGNVLEITGTFTLAQLEDDISFF